MNNKKLVQIAVIVVASVWIFCIVLFISYKNAIKNRPVAEITSDFQFSTAAISTQPPASTTEPAAPSVTIGENNVTTNASVDKPQWVIDEEASKKAEEEAKTTTAKANLPTGKKDIIKAYVTAINKLKKKTDFTLVKTENMTVNIDEISGGDTVKNIAEQIIKSNNRNGSTTYTFVNGVDNGGKTPNQVVPPGSSNAQIDEKYVTKATSSEGTNGSYKIRLELGKQTQTLDTPAPGYSTLLDLIDINSLGLTSTMSVSELNIIYDNSYVEATIDNKGNITSMKQYVEVVEGTGSGRVTLIPTSMKMHGNYTCDYKITY